MNVAFIMQVEENDDPFKYTLRGWRADAQAHRYWLFVTDAMGEAFTIELEVDIEPNRIPREPERVVFRDGLTWLETDFEAFCVGSWSRRVPMDTERSSFGPKLAEAAGAGPDKAATLTPAQHKRNVKAARAKERIDPRGVALIEREFAYVKGSAKRRGEIVAARCASGRWTHSQINETVSRKDHVKITGRYVCDLITRRKPQKKKRLP